MENCQVYVHFQANQLNKGASLQIGCSAFSYAGFENNGRMRGGAFQAELPDHLNPSSAYAVSSAMRKCPPE